MKCVFITTLIEEQLTGKQHGTPLQYGLKIFRKNDTLDPAKKHKIGVNCALLRPKLQFIHKILCQFDTI